MQPNNRSSFIPKKSIKRVERVRSGKQIYLLSYIAYAVFFATLIVAGAVFFYTSTLQGQLEERIAELETQRVAFSQGDIERVKEFERKLKISEYLFDQHVSVYSVFNELEKFAAEGVLYSSFSYRRVDDQTAEISITGASNKFDAPAFQRNILEQADVLGGASFTSIAKAGPTGIAEQNALSNDENVSNTILPVDFTIIRDVPTEEMPFEISAYERRPVAPTLPVISDFDVASGTDEALISDSDNLDV